MEETSRPRQLPLVQKTPMCTCMQRWTKTMPERSNRQCCLMILLQVAISVGVVCISNTIGFSSNGEQANNGGMIESPRFRRHASSPNTHEPSGGQFAWASYYLDQERFVKKDRNETGTSFIPWIADDSDTTIPLTNNSCFNITVGGVYSVYSKLTFVFTPKNVTQSTYHNVKLLRWNPENGSREVSILEKNVISLPNVTLRQYRMFQTSQILFLRTFMPGDVICVVVPDTSLIYHSKIDNTVNMHTLGYTVR